MIVIQDTREKNPLNFPKDWEVVVAKLDTGDYSICPSNKIQDKYTDAELENILCIERKSCPSEIFRNFTEKRFKSCLERMSCYKHKYMVMEFSFNNILTFPVGSSVPRRKWKYLKVNPKFIIACITSMSVEYDIMPVFAGDADNASYIVQNLIKKVHKKYNLE